MSTTAEELYDGGVQAAVDGGVFVDHVGGVVVPWNDYSDVGMFMEAHARGSFTASIAAKPRLPLLAFHDNRRFPLGHAVDWSDEPTGLRARFKLNVTPDAQMLGQLMLSGEPMGLSVGFVPERSEWRYAADWNPDLGPDHMDRLVRLRSRWVEVSITPTPAFAAAMIDTIDAEATSERACPKRDAARVWLERHRQAGGRLVA